MLCPPSSFRQGRCILCFPQQGTSDVEAAVAASQRRGVSEVVRELPASLWELLAKWSGTKGIPVNVRSFTTGDTKLSITPLLNRCLGQNKMGSDCVFLKSCSWMWWPPLKPCQRDVFILFLFFWNPFTLPHLLQDFTPLLGITLIPKWLPSR